MPSSIINSDDGLVSGTSGIKTTGGDDGVLNIQSNGTTAVTVNASGNVGIGTTTPSYSFNVYRSGDASIGIDGDTSAFARASIYNSSTNSSGLQMAKYRGTLASPTAVNSADGVGQLNYLAYGGTNLRSIARIDGVVDTYTSDTNISGNLRFLTNGGSTTVTERMRIDSSGNVGIGTSSPGLFGVSSGKLLDVVSSSNYAFVQLQGSSAAGGAIDFGDSSVRHAEIASLNGSALAFYTNGTNSGNALTERMRIDSSGNLLVGTTSNAVTSGGHLFAPGSSSAYYIGHATGTASGTEYIQFRINNGTIGSITQNGTTAVAYNTSSDYRLKHDIQPMTGALAKVAALKPCTYKWNADNSAGEGFIAHELQEVAPYAVSGEKDGEEMQGVDYGKLTPILTAALQEAIAKIETLEARIAVLEAK